MGGRRDPAASHPVALVGVVALGGGLGSLARWGIGLLPEAPHGGFPWGTFLVNVTGAFAIGLLVSVLGARLPTSQLVRPFLGPGFLGGYTTFSAYMADTGDLMDAGRGALAGVYLFGTLACGLLGVVLGMALATRLLEQPPRAVPSPDEQAPA